MNAAREGRLARITKIFFVGPVVGKISLGVETANGNTGNGGVPGATVLVEVGTGCGTNRFFRSLFKRRRERLLGPLFFTVGRMTVLEKVGRHWIDYVLLLIGHVSPHLVNSR